MVPQHCRVPPPQVFDANNNGMIDAKEWAKTLGDLGADGEAAKRCAGGSARGCVYLGCGGVERRRLFAAAARPGGEAAKRCAGRQARVQTGVHTGGSRWHMAAACSSCCRGGLVSARSLIVRSNT